MAFIPRLMMFLAVIAGGSWVWTVTSPFFTTQSETQYAATFVPAPRKYVPPPVMGSSTASASSTDAMSSTTSVTATSTIILDL